MCTGYTDEGAPIVELVAWPFVMPHTLVAGLYTSSRKVSKKNKICSMKISSYGELSWLAKLHCTSNLVRS